jgi:preprotein translocase subunit YajC
MVNSGYQKGGKQMKIGDKVVDRNGYTGIVTNIFPKTGQIQVQQKSNVWCTYDNKDMLRVLVSK